MRVDPLQTTSLDSVDQWLLPRNAFRIPIPKDENCLYKAIAEQLHPCQNYYYKVKIKVHDFYLKISPDGDFEAMQARRKLEVISKAYERCIMLYVKIGGDPETIGSFGGTKTAIYLRLDEEDGSFESIQPVEHVKNLAVLQSIVYEILYEGSFGISKEKQMETVEKVRQKSYNHSQTQKQRVAVKHSPTVTNGSGDEDRIPNSAGLASQQSSNNEQTSVQLEVPPFPFRVAKSLDPGIYRNAQFDIWSDDKKAKGEQLKPGDTVIVRNHHGSGAEKVIGHVQAVSDSDATVEVYVESAYKGKRIVVDRSQVSKVSKPKKRRSRSGTRAVAENSERSKITPPRARSGAHLEQNILPSSHLYHDVPICPQQNMARLPQQSRRPVHQQNIQQPPMLPQFSQLMSQQPDQSYGIRAGTQAPTAPPCQYSLPAQPAYHCSTEMQPFRCVVMVSPLPQYPQTDSFGSQPMAQYTSIMQHPISGCNAISQDFSSLNLDAPDFGNQGTGCGNAASPYLPTAYPQQTVCTTLQQQ